MKKKVLFIADWPDNLENKEALQTLLNKEYSENYEWTVWSCKKRKDNRLLYRWLCYTKGALYALNNRKKYHAIVMWQQMVGYILFEIVSIIRLKIPDIVLYTFIYNSSTRSKYFQKHMVKNALKHSKAIFWDSSEMAQEVKNDFPKFTLKNHSTLNPIMDVIDASLPVDKELDDPYFRNGVYTAGRSERDFNIVIKAFRNTDIPVTIVCCDDYTFTETNITSNIRILRFSQVSNEQYYALAGQAFCILISVLNEKSSVGQLIIAFAMDNLKPIIATECYGVRDYIINNKNGVLFKVGQSDEIRKAYEKLKNDEAFTNTLISNAKITLKEMSPGIFIEKVIKIIEN